MFRPCHPQKDKTQLYMTENEIRGRPKKENQQDNSQNILLNKYNKTINL